MELPPSSEGTPLPYWVVFSSENICEGPENNPKCEKVAIELLALDGFGAIWGRGERLHTPDSQPKKFDLIRQDINEISFHSRKIGSLPAKTGRQCENPIRIGALCSEACKCSQGVAYNDLTTPRYDYNAFYDKSSSCSEIRREVESDFSWLPGYD
ncbi:hypothetical protein AVEN_37251-1 [Araneus ventricosus]|uniref:Uncharacterized protein n=1 Tax=Araneus ventricosus TaxID=182803 RepID=A0A4Y2P298_ARAVE|nr:hypothetical protein AVEN_37251-1 [Araneus ventricosus]